ncbi:MAG: class I SAM-dependent methyltransferase [Candidatus Methanomethylicia archaeon]
MPEEIPWPFSRLYDRYVNRVFVKWFKQIASEIRDSHISGTILDIGTGPGRLPIEIVKQVPNVKVIGIDISKSMIKIARKNAEKEGIDKVEFRIGSAYNTGFKDLSVDLVLSTGLIHHLKEAVKAFNEIYRILKYKGEAWIYDGRRDATKIEIEETIRSMDMEKDLPLPLWIIERIWPYMHIGCKTDVYITGKIGEALRKSLFKSYNIDKKGAYIKITLKKT